MIVVLVVFVSCSNDDDKTVYTVTFETDGGTPVPSVQKVEEGNAVTAPVTNPTKAGYVFVYWHLSGATTAYNFQSPINNNITLYAKWQEEAIAEYWQVAWELNGGSWTSGDNHDTQVVKGGTLSEPNAPTKSGSTFDGWYKEDALTNKVTFPYDVSNITSNIILYAKWGTEAPVGKGFVMTASGDYNNFRLKADGTLIAYGFNGYGQLGTGNTNDVESSIDVAEDVSKVYAGPNTTFIVKTDGSMLATGLNRIGQLGLGDETSRNNFTVIPVNDVKEVAVGSYHTHLLKNDGSLWATGSNGYGQLGVGDENQRTTFTATNLTSDVIAVSAGSEHSLALKKDGTVWGTGYGYVGTFGGEQSFSTFTQLRSGAKAIAASAYHSLILMNDGTVYASGINNRGQLGIGNFSEYVKSFTQAIDDTGASLTNVTAIVTGTQSSFAFKSDGTVWAAGNNSYGQLGINDKGSYEKFTKIDETGIKSISAGSIQSMSINNDNQSELFGSVNPNPYAQLNGSGKIIIESHFQLSRVNLYDYSKTACIFEAFKACEISVKPGYYYLALTTKNNGGVVLNFANFPINANETARLTLEYNSISGVYSWVVTRSTK